MLVSANMWHSCGVFSEEALFQRSSPAVREAFDALRSAVSNEAAVTVTPQKTRIVFQIRTRFISAYPRRGHLNVGFVFTASDACPRVHKIEGPISGAFVHYVKLTGAPDVDDEIVAFIRRAIPYGEQAPR
jgi:hypothetical protein